MLVAELAILLNLKLAGLILLILGDGIVAALAFLTRQQYYLPHASFPCHDKVVPRKLQFPCSQPILCV
jgi:hypothetical protein